MAEPGIEIGLWRFDDLAEGFSHFDAEELFEDRAVEALDEAVGLRRLHRCPAMFDAVEIEIELIRVVLRPLELSVGTAFTGRSRLR